MSEDRDPVLASGQDELNDDDSDQRGLFGSGSEDEETMYGLLRSALTKS